MIGDGLGKYQLFMLSVVRIITGLVFLEHGIQKFLSFPPGDADTGAGSRP